MVQMKTLSHGSPKLPALSSFVKQTNCTNAELKNRHDLRFELF